MGGGEAAASDQNCERWRKVKGRCFDTGAQGPGGRRDISHLNWKPCEAIRESGEFSEMMLLGIVGNEELHSSCTSFLWSLHWHKRSWRTVALISPNECSKILESPGRWRVPGAGRDLAPSAACLKGGRMRDISSFLSNLLTPSTSWSAGRGGGSRGPQVGASPATSALQAEVLLSSFCHMKS